MTSEARVGSSTVIAAYSVQVASDLSRLPPNVRRSARVHANGEVSWRDEDAAEAINALAESGRVVLGLDLRFYARDGTFLEVAWMVLGRDPGMDRWASTSQARADALARLSRIDDFQMPKDMVERRVLITWD
jgi:hypothetical protein